MDHLSQREAQMPQIKSGICRLHLGGGGKSGENMSSNIFQFRVVRLLRSTARADGLYNKFQQKLWESECKQVRRFYSIKTTLYNIQQINCGSSYEKTFTWDGGLWCKDANFPPQLSHAASQLPHFSSRWPHLSPHYPWSDLTGPIQSIPNTLEDDPIYFALW